jgi:hypothetical protein
VRADRGRLSDFQAKLTRAGVELGWPNIRAY